MTSVQKQLDDVSADRNLHTMEKANIELGVRIEKLSNNLQQKTSSVKQKKVFEMTK